MDKQGVKKIQYQVDGQQVVRVSSSELQQNLKQVMQLLSEGYFIEVTKHRTKVGMIVPY
ncbi:hypothetical protein Psal006b_01720 [Piscirickettsia salmonis]|uniref:Prevent-host-death protein n=1 Tax=Piscirickettsia salmonis TaxID=1238 RepID=A0A9Q6LSR1_PISSA|nr:hypothetical protein [Piscirickettsia salmonis]OAJ34653.1 hypothetical protein A0O36_01145 [Piscirickettsiaceae bacterium NZ-RLO1]ALA24864.1 prevent-host-death protein [Piscirickettsia salmonis]ALB22668.1 prevent-host-death protein [Piscirickettsia salmonis]QGN77475.1 hypothetical protein Psal001_01686 [Piscirickettsia salmonis]QGN81062.1 hypothetical protein Psal002_01708 [Piscirickettsia salmonis]